jgi:hypothetical protein
VGYGQTVTCAITGPGNLQRHDFDATAGDHLFVRVTRLSGDFALVPSYSVLGPSGGPGCPPGDDCVLRAAGRYSVVVQDMLGHASGEYALYLQRKNDPVGCGDIRIGEAAEGTLQPPGSMACAIFTAGAGDRVRVSAVGLEGGAPQFTELDILAAAGGGSACSTQENCQLASSGRYIVLAASSGLANQTGPYRITVTCLAGPCRGG